MKKILFLAAALALAASGSALAHGRVSVGVGFGFGYPFWGPPWYPAYPAYYPVPVAVPAQPVTYVEQPRAAAAPSDSGAWWYYCDSARGYYPYVRECPAGWQRVAPTPPPPAK